MSIRPVVCRRARLVLAAFKTAHDSWQDATTSTVLKEGDPVLFVGPTEDVESFAQLR